MHFGQGTLIEAAPEGTRRTVAVGEIGAHFIAHAIDDLLQLPDFALVGGNHFDCLDSAFAKLGKHLIPGFGIHRIFMPHPVRGLVCVGVFHAADFAFLLMEMKLGIIRGELLKGFLSSRKVLPTRSGVSDRKVRDLSNLRKLSYT